MLNLIWSVLWALVAVGGLRFFAKRQYHQFGLLLLCGIGMMIAMIWHSFPVPGLVLFWGAWFVLLLVATFSTIKAVPMGQAAVGILAVAGIIAVLLGHQAPSIQNTGAGKAFPAYVVASVGTPLKAQDAPQGSCDRVKYLAYDAPAGSHNFGAPLTLADPTNVNEAVTELYKAVSCDPLALATDEEFIKNGENLDPATASANATRYVSDSTRKEWADAINRIRERTASYYLVNADGIHYDSLGMIPGASTDVMPTLTKFGQQPDLGLALVLVDKDGHESAFRMWCHIQPAVKQFAKVTPAPAVVQPAPPKSPGIPPKPKGNGSTPPKPPSSTTPQGSTTTQPSTTTTAPPTSTTTTTTSTTTTTTAPPSSTTTSPPTTTTTAPPTTTTETTPTKPSDRSQWPNDTDKPTVAPPPGNPETSVPTEPTPVNPSQLPGSEVTDTAIPAPSVETPPQTSRNIPTPEPSVPATANPGTSISDPPPPGSHGATVAPLDAPAPAAPQASDPAPQQQASPAAPAAPQMPASAPQAPAAPAEVAPPANAGGNSDTAPIPAPYPTNDSSSGTSAGTGGGIGGTLPGAGMMLLVPAGAWIRRKLDL